MYNNEKFIGKKLIGKWVLSSVLLVLLVLSVKTEALGASSAPDFPKKITAYFTDDVEEHYVYKVTNLSEDRKISDIKSSNPKIAKAWYDWALIGGPEVLYIGLEPTVKNNKFKTGKTTVSFTVTQNGKKYKVSTEVTIRKLTTPFKKLQINGKNYANALNKSASLTVKAGKEAKIKYQLKSKNYEITGRNKKWKSVKLKSGKTVKTPFHINVSLKRNKYIWSYTAWDIDLTKK